MGLDPLNFSLLELLEQHVPTHETSATHPPVYHEAVDNEFELGRRPLKAVVVDRSQGWQVESLPPLLVEQHEASSGHFVPFLEGGVGVILHGSDQT